jgi:acetyl esterase/lipase
MHLLRPRTRGSEPMPVLIWIHGGAWRSGSKEGGIRRLVPYALRGYFCATIEYRLSDEAVWPAQIEDCKCAVRFLRAKAEQYNLNADRIGVWGSSAGGHLVAMLGTSGGAKELEGIGGWPESSSRVSAVCDWFGPSDLARIGDAPSHMDHLAANSPESRLLGGAVLENQEKARQASPVTYVTDDDPPFLIMHGDQDPTVPLQQSRILHAALKEAGVESTLHVVEGAGHGFRGPEIDRMVQRFFDFHLKGVKPEEPPALEPRAEDS